MQGDEIWVNKNFINPKQVQAQTGLKVVESGNDDKPIEEIVIEIN
jgi:hypothetical protein